MKKNLRKIATFVLAVALVFAMSVPALALNSGDYSSAYVISDRSIPTYSSSIKVAVVIQSRQYSESNSTYINDYAYVTIPYNGSGIYTVKDALLAFNSQNNGITACTASGTPITSSSSSVYSFKYTTNYTTYTFGPKFYYNHGDGATLCDGWMFRVNSKLPLDSEDGDQYSGGPWGDDITTARVANGDVVFFYTDYPWDDGSTQMATEFVGAQISYSGNTLSTQLVSTHDWYDDKTNDYYWNIDPFTDFTDTYFNSLTGYILNENGYVIDTMSINPTTCTGTKTISLSSGTYYLYVPTGSFKTLTGYVNYAMTNSQSISYINTTATFETFTVN